MAEAIRDRIARGKINLIWVGLGLGVSYWIFESVRESLVFPRSNILEGAFAPGATAFWMRLLVVCILILFGVIAQALRTRVEKRKKLRHSLAGMSGIVLSGLGFAALYWILESLRGLFHYEKQSASEWFLSPGPNGLLMRILAMAILILFSLYAQSLANKRRKAEVALKKSNDAFERQVTQRTVELSERSTELTKSNELLRNETQEGQHEL